MLIVFEGEKIRHEVCCNLHFASTASAHLVV